MFRLSVGPGNLPNLCSLNDHLIRIKSTLDDKFVKFLNIPLQFGYVFWTYFWLCIFLALHFFYGNFNNHYFCTQLCLYPEGTRFTQKKHETSVKFAQERGLPVLKHHLIPRTKGFTTSLPFVKEKGACILDIQIAFKKDDPIEPTFTNLLFGRGCTSHFYVRRIDPKSISDDENEAAEWLHETFRHKDKLQESFHTHGDFFTGSGVKPIKPVRMPSNYLQFNFSYFFFYVMSIK